MLSQELRHAVELEEELQREFDAADIAGARERVRAIVLARNAKRIPDDLEFEPVDAGGVPAEWVVPPLDPERRVAVFVHGGFTFGSPAESRELTGRLARAAQSRVLALDVRLAPEAVFPAPIDDVLTAFRWLIADGADPREIALVGESTGAAAVLAAAIALRDAGEAGPGALALLSPVLDLRPRDDAGAGEDPLDTAAVVLRDAALYLGGADAGDPRVSPILAELAGLPALFVQAGSADGTRADARRLADGARAAGVVVVDQEWEGMIHRWQGHPHVYDAARAVHQVGDFLLRRIGPGYVPVRPPA